MITRNGNKTHQRFGKIFLYFVLVVTITAVIGLIFYRNRPFLIVLTMLAAYQAFTGYRLTQSKDKGPGLLDFGFNLICLAYGIVFLFQLPDLNPVMQKPVIYFTLFFLFLIMLYDMIRFLARKKWNPKSLWIYEHIFKMIGAYSGLFSAFSGTVLTQWEPYNTIIPSSLCLFLIAGLIVRKINIKKSLINQYD